MNPDFGITPQLIALTATQEGEVLHPYLCPAGKPTIGYGHRIPDLTHPPITHEQAVELLKSDLRAHRDAVVRLSPGLLTEPELRCSALTDFSFNVGDGAYAMAKLRLYVDRKDWESAAAQLRRWIYAYSPLAHKEVPLDGLIKRRQITAGWLEHPCL